MADPDACRVGNYLRCYQLDLDTVNLSLDTKGTACRSTQLAVKIVIEAGELKYKKVLVG
jgi:hypothetical protein